MLRSELKSIDFQTTLAAEVVSPPGYERLIEVYAERVLQLTKEKPIGLILGRDHKINLRRGDDGIVRISIDGFKLPDPDNNEEDGGALANELELSVGAKVEITRSGELAEIQIEQIEVQEDEDSNDVYCIDLPDEVVNLRGEQIDFTDVNNDWALSILIGRRLGDNKIVITNYDSESGVAVPFQRPESFDQSQSEAEPDSWNNEMAGMLRNSASQTAYENFMKKPGADKKVAIIIAMAAYLYRDQLKDMGRAGFTSMVQRIKAAFENN